MTADLNCTYLILFMDNKNVYFLPNSGLFWLYFHGIMFLFFLKIYLFIWERDKEHGNTSRGRDRGGERVIISSWLSPHVCYYSRRSTQLRSIQEEGTCRLICMRVKIFRLSKVDPEELHIQGRDYVVYAPSVTFPWWIASLSDVWHLWFCSYSICFGFKTMPVLEGCVETESWRSPCVG